MHFHIRLAALALVAACQTHGQGGSAIITLVMPPPGGEGYSVLQDGGMFADGATAAYYNPALLADLARNTGSQLHYSESRQDLLPVLGIEDLDHDFRAAALVLPDPAGGTDLGLAYFRNHVRFGWNSWIDSDGRQTDPFLSDETVQGLAIGIRLGIPVSLGGTAKFFDSKLAQGRTSSGADIEGRASGWAFDLGALVNPRLRTRPGSGIPFLEIVPSFSTALQNMGPDAFYDRPGEADPIPLGWNYGLGLQTNALDLLRFEGAVTASREMASREGWFDFDNEPVRQMGLSIDALFFRFSKGWLKDNPGKRDEEHTGYSYGMDLRTAYRAWRRLVTRDFTSPPEAFDREYPFAWTRVFGIPFRANPRVTFGRREIDSWDNGIRQGQKAYFTSFSL